MAPTLSMNDAVLMVSLLYLSIDMQYQWHEFESCQWPIHRWLLVSYIFIVAFRAMHILGSMKAAADSGDFLLNLRHKDTLPRLLLHFTWLVVLPLFAAWSAVGTYWLWDSKRVSSKCLPMGMPLVFIVTWQALSYAWILLHTTLGGIAWILERRLRRTEAIMRGVEDSDTVSRWGSFSQMSDYTALANNSLGGLSPDQIHALPECLASELNQSDDMECSICLNELCSDDCNDDCVRKLATCGHTFHRACIDLWLLRRADCPLCKQSVLAHDDKSKGAGTMSGATSALALASSEVEHWHV